VTTYAVVRDLMDRSRIESGLGEKPTYRAATAVAAEAGAGDLVLVDLAAAPPDQLEALAATGARVVGFASHVDDVTIATARAAGVEALARSVFFRRIAEL